MQSEEYWNLLNIHYNALYYIKSSPNSIFSFAPHDLDPWAQSVWVNSIAIWNGSGCVHFSAISGITSMKKTNTKKPFTCTQYISIDFIASKYSFECIRLERKEKNIEMKRIYKNFRYPHTHTSARGRPLFLILASPYRKLSNCCKCVDHLLFGSWYLSWNISCSQPSSTCSFNFSCSGWSFSLAFFRLLS